MDWVCADWDEQERQMVVAYLKDVKGKGHSVVLGIEWCRFRCSTKSIGGPYFYQNEYFIWSNIFTHVVEHHYVKPPQQVIDWIRWTFENKPTVELFNAASKPLPQLNPQQIQQQKTYPTNGFGGQLWLIPNPAKVPHEVLKAFRRLPEYAGASTKNIMDLIKSNDKVLLSKNCDFADYKTILEAVKAQGILLEFVEK
jgi:hypothetical protein